MENRFIRTCQACDNKQVDKDPAIHYPHSIPDSYLNRKCNKCKSEALDYGSYESNPDADYTTE